MAPIHITPPLLIAAGAIWPPVCATVVALRFIARRVQNVQLGIDDWLVLPALLLLIGMAAAILRGVDLDALGYPNPATKSTDWALVAATYQHRITSQVFWAVELMLVLALGLIKLSFMFFYRRIFRPNDSRHFDRIMFTVVAIIVAWTVSFFFAQMFACGIHFDYLWTTFPNEVDHGKCVKTLILQNAFAISDFITDFIVLIFPLPFIWKLRLSRNRKLGVTGIFLLGSFALDSSIARVVIYAQARAAGSSRSPRVELNEEGKQTIQTEDSDLAQRIFPVYSVAAIYIMIMEAGFALCAANLSILYGMFKTNGLQKVKRSIRSFFSAHRPSHGSVVGSQRYRERLGSQDSDPRVGVDVAVSERSRVNVELLPVRADGGSRANRDAGGADNMV